MIKQCIVEVKGEFSHRLSQTNTDKRIEGLRVAGYRLRDACCEVLVEKRKRQGAPRSILSSRPRELPPEALTESYVNLSIHTALHAPCN